MSAGKYWFLMFLSVVIAVLILIEIVCENQVSLLTNRVSNNQTYIIQAQQQSASIRQLVQRIAAESQHDPALLELLTKRGLHVTKSADDAITPTATPSTPPTK